MKITLLEGFYGGSHRLWADGLKAYSRHHIDILSLPDRFWKWRMHGGAVTLARQFLAEKHQPDLIIASDLIDLSLFLSLTRKTTAQVPVGLYFHENQLTYPWSPEDPDPKLHRDLHYAFINYQNALSADRVWFNSHYHQRSFLEALPKFLAQYPDHRNLHDLDGLSQKCSVIPVGIDDSDLKMHRPNEKVKNEAVHILWNHRWEYDKNPDAFFQMLFQLDRLGKEFKLIVTGKSGTQQPAIFAEARERLSSRIVHWGFCTQRSDYYKLLWQADVLPVTAIQDFFGMSVIESMLSDCVPLLPDRLAYPEHIPVDRHDQLLYQTTDHLLEKIGDWVEAGPPICHPSKWVERYRCQEVIPQYDQIFEEIIST